MKKGTGRCRLYRFMICRDTISHRNYKCVYFCVHAFHDMTNEGSVYNQPLVIANKGEKIRKRDVVNRWTHSKKWVDSECCIAKQLWIAIENGPFLTWATSFWPRAQRETQPIEEKRKQEKNVAFTRQTTYIRHCVRITLCYLQISILDLPWFVWCCRRNQYSVYSTHNHNKASFVQKVQFGFYIRKIIRYCSDHELISRIAGKNWQFW